MLGRAGRCLSRRCASTSSRAPPLVGVASDITANDDGHRFADKHGVGDKYVRAVAEWAPCTPMIIPSLLDHVADDAKDDWAVAVLSRLDGVYLAGNPSNIHPSWYGVDEEACHAPFDRPRDEVAILLARHALDMGVPLLGVCRGLQEINVALGGTIKPLSRDPVYHGFPQGPPDTMYGPSHPVTLETGGLLSTILGTDAPLDVNSCHYQGLDDLGDRVAVEARAPDGCVEAIRVDDAPAFALAPIPRPTRERSARPRLRRLRVREVTTSNRRPCNGTRSTSRRPGPPRRRSTRPSATPAGAARRGGRDLVVTWSTFTTAESEGPTSGAYSIMLSTPPAGGAQA